MRRRKQRSFSLNPRRTLGFLLALGVFIGIGWLFRPSAFPISNVKIFGNLAYLSEPEIANVVSPHIKRGFFAVKVSNLRQQLVELPWVNHADVRRVWPGQLVIRIHEHTPATFWRNDALISVDGEMFAPATIANVKALPHLWGPKLQHEAVWAQYLRFKTMVTPLGLSIERCEMASRGAWQLQLSNHIVVVLGTQDIESRLQRFVRAYQKTLHEKQDRIEYVDLRYTSGMSVGWRKG